MERYCNKAKVFVVKVNRVNDPEIGRGIIVRKLFITKKKSDFSPTQFDSKNIELLRYILGQDKLKKVFYYLYKYNLLIYDTTTDYWSTYPIQTRQWIASFPSSLKDYLLLGLCARLSVGKRIFISLAVISIYNDFASIICISNFIYIPNNVYPY